MQILCLGTVLRPEAFGYNQAANPASTKWLKNFLCSLEDAGADIRLVGHCYSRAWPFGSISPGSSDYLAHIHSNRLVRFWNLPGVRFISLKRGYWKAAQKQTENWNPDLIMTYNPYPWHVVPSRNLRAKYDIPWVSLNLDFDDVGSDWRDFFKAAGDADGHLFLSHWGYEHAPVAQKIHLDSGVSAIPANFGSPGATDPLTIVYLGKLGKSGGLDILLKLPELVQNRNVRFVYGGKGYPDADAKLKALAARDSRVEYLGFVEESEVAALFDRASIFLNPRDPEEVVNDMVFPSKIMEYLKYGKTVVSTWTKGLDPVYHDLMLISGSPRAEDFAATLSKAIAEVDSERSARADRIRAFLEHSRLWSKQAKRFVCFTNQVIENYRVGQ